MAILSSRNFAVNVEDENKNEEIKVIEEPQNNSSQEQDNGENVLEESNDVFENKEINHNPIEKQEELNYTQDSEEENDNMENNKIVEVKRGRGRPRKEKVEEGELVIKSDEQFAEVLARAEKLMRKNEEPLSQSQQKRVEKALKELVDAMKKYKEEN